MKLEINAEDIKDKVNPELSVQLGEPAWSEVDKDGNPTKNAVPVYDDPRITAEDIALIEAVVENPEKLETLKEDETVKEAYKAEIDEKKLIINEKLAQEDMI